MTVLDIVFIADLILKESYPKNQISSSISLFAGCMSFDPIKLIGYTSHFESLFLHSMRIIALKD